MTYFTGTVAAVPTANKQLYLDYVQAVWPLFNAQGAVRMVETWGVDVPKGKVTDFYRSVAAKPDETITFSWIEWPDKATADAAWETMMSSPDATNWPKQPLDGSRMIYGSFEPVFERGSISGAGYYQGFLLAVPEANKAPYIEMAGEAWDHFQKGGAVGTVENWGVDIPRGKQTDFYRATNWVDGEAVLFSWIAWPDRETCDAAARAMETDFDGADMPEMPFDGMRMMWGGFEPLFESRPAS